MNWNGHRISSIVFRFTESMKICQNQKFSFDRNYIIQNLTNKEQKKLKSVNQGFYNVSLEEYFVFPDINTFSTTTCSCQATVIKRGGNAN